MMPLRWGVSGWVGGGRVGAGAWRAGGGAWAPEMGKQPTQESNDDVLLPAAMGHCQPPLSRHAPSDPAPQATRVAPNTV